MPAITSMTAKSRHGFILLIVLALLGVLAALAISLVDRSDTAIQLSNRTHQATEALLNARSGLEHGLASLKGKLSTDLLNTSRLSSTWTNEPNVSWSDVTIMDLSGTININDGLAAGQLEENIDGSFTYDASEIDPWDTMAAAENRSGRLNLRLRRLLNSYGDAHRFLAEVGNPEWNSVQFGIDPKNYGTPFVSTDTSARGRFITMPALDMNHLPVPAAQSRALGDRIIAARSQTGFNRVDDIRNIVNTWAATAFSDLGTYLAQFKQASFYDLMQDDLSIDSYEDTATIRMDREFGNFHTPTNGKMPQGNVIALDEAPPDMENLWWPHSTPRINLNSASEMVRAAVFHAPANVGYVCEGLHTFWHHANKNSAGQDLAYGGTAARISYQNIQGTQGGYHHLMKTIGVSGPSFEMANRVENGNAETDSHLMSLRDALAYAKGYEAYTSSPYGYNIPDSFDQFRDWLNWMRTEGVSPERAPKNPPNNANFNRYYNDYFRNTYLEKSLPEILGGVRRLPGWLHAPVALLSPYHQTAQPNITGWGSIHNQAFRSVEDFVYRHHLPAISFTPSGGYRLKSIGHFSMQGQMAIRTIRATYHGLLETVIIRSQEKFSQHTDAASDPKIQIGPEPSGVPASAYLGLVGLKDIMIDPLAGGQPAPSYSSTYAFDGNLSPWSPTIGTNAFSPVLTDITEKPPVGIANYFPSFDLPWSAVIQTDLDKLRAASAPPAGETFRVPLDSLTAWNSCHSGVTHGTVGAAISWIESKLNLKTGYPGPGAGLDQYIWWLKSLGPIEVISGLAGPPPMPPPTIVRVHVPTLYPHRWAGNVGLPHQTLSKSYLEDENVSLFKKGSEGSDLSPFGGISLGQRGHGNFSSFTDSLYWNPEELLNNTISTGARFNKAFISLWMRNPGGYLLATAPRTILHGNFWEFVELENPNSWPNGKTPPLLGPTDFSTTMRPVHLDFSIQVEWGSPTKRKNNFYCKVSQSVIDKPDGHDKTRNMVMKVPSINAYPQVTPPYNGATMRIVNHPDMLGFSPSDMMGITYQNQSSKDRWRFRQDKIPYKSSVGTWYIPRGSLQKTIASAADDHLNIPGVWNRLVLGWDLSQPAPAENMAWLDIPTASTNSTTTVTNRYTNPPGNDRMTLSLGERPSFRHKDMWTRKVAGSPWTFKNTDPDNPNGTLTAYQRMDTLFDNIDIRFGYAGIPGGALGGTANRAALDDSFPSSTNYADYRSKRYPITTENEADYGTPAASEPEWILNPQIPAGSKLIALSARIYDVPDLGGSYNSPVVSLSALDGATPFTPYYVSAQAAYTSPELALYGADAAGINTRLKLTYLSQDPSGNPVKDRLSDIPWIQEVSWSYIPAGQPRLTRYVIE